MLEQTKRNYDLKFFLSEYTFNLAKIALKHASVNAFIGFKTLIMKFAQLGDNIIIMVDSLVTIGVSENWIFGGFLDKRIGVRKL